MNILATTNLKPHQSSQINELWDEAYPIQLNNRFGKLLEDVEEYTHYLVENSDEKILGWAVVFRKDNELRFSIIVEEKQHHQGIGSILMEKLKNDYTELYGWVIDHNNDKKRNGEHYISPLPFYQKLGFEILYDVRLDLDMLKAVKIRWSKSKHI